MNWTKSSYSADVGNCVELAEADDATVHVRNSRHPERGSLVVPAGVVGDFVAACRSGELDDLAS